MSPWTIKVAPTVACCHAEIQIVHDALIDIATIAERAFAS
jgi:hypothetical protein